MFLTYFFVFMFLVVGPLLASLYLTHKWALEDAGTDLEVSALRSADLRRIPDRKKLILLMLWLPAAAFLMAVVSYAIISVVFFG